MIVQDVVSVVLVLILNVIIILAGRLYFKLTN